MTQSTIDGPGLDLDALRSSVRDLVDRLFRHHRRTIAEILLHQYRKWDRPSSSSSDPRNNLASLVELIGDAFYVVPALEMALRHVTVAARRSTTFVVCFNHSDVIGSSFPGHGSDLVYLFGGPISDGIDPFQHGAYNRSEKTFSEVYLQYLTQFVRTGYERTVTVPRSSFLAHYYLMRKFLPRLAFMYIQCSHLLSSNA